ncbi:putative Peptidyl-prolyl cis-trans isomerase [Daphnia magna]|uniref:Putative Peptidyl-prolyl cis-trans isomerase n=1 Tax=Daphnia magna TaxID=35525 RepID=A0A164MBL0_9CRUS|nr:putative Peptidyl-prolyl cis-trans isomerase [Daphnia magna]
MHSIFRKIYYGMSVVLGLVVTDKDYRLTDEVKIVECTIKYESRFHY